MAGFNDAVLDDAKGRVRQALDEGEPLELLAFPFGEGNRRLEGTLRAG